VPNKGDVAWMMTSTALVLMMSVPALALFYGGMVRSKNTLSMLMQVFVVFSLVTVLWCIYGYSLAFTEGNRFFGGFDRLFLKGTFDPVKGEFSLASTFSKGTPLYELVFVAFQATFAAITCCLVLGAIAERAKFAAVLAFIVLWFTFAYRAGRAHGVVLDGAGCVHQRQGRRRDERQGGACCGSGARSTFAGGTVVHINSGIAGLVGAYLIGKRVGYGKEALMPHNLTLTMIGAALLWTGWFGFNAGSALEANGTAGPRVHQHLSSDRMRGACVDARRSDVQGQAFDARRSVGCGGRAGCDHARGRQRRHPGRVRDRLRRGLRLPVGRQRPEAHAQGRRLARRLRRARVGGILGALLTGVFNDPSLGGPRLPEQLVRDEARLRGASARRSGRRRRRSASRSCGPASSPRSRTRWST
jgi:Amt family ammonium transporter